MNDNFIYYFTNNIILHSGNCATNFHFHCYFEQVSLQMHSHYAHRITDCFHFLIVPSQFLNQKCSIMIIRHTHFLLCTISKLPPPIISCSMSFWYRKLTKFTQKVPMKFTPFSWFYSDIQKHYNTNLIDSMSQRHIRPQNK